MVLALKHAQTVQSKAGQQRYAEAMDGDPFVAYRQELGLRDLDAKTKMRYTQIAERYKDWLKDRAINPETARLFLAHLRDLGYRPATIELYYVGLRILLDFLGLKLQVKLRKPQTLPPLFDPGDMERLVEQARHGLPGQGEAVVLRNSNFLIVLMDAGLRISEAVGLRVGDVDFTRGVLVVRHGKGQKQRAIPLTARAAVALRSQSRGKGAQQRVFEPGNRRNFYRAIVKLARSVGLDGLHPHSLRHFFGTQLAERGVRLEVIAELMGHADLDTTRIYVAVSGRALREAVSALESPATPPLPRPLVTQPPRVDDPLGEIGLSWELPPG
jgi:integrase/recombinase XerD